MQWAITTKHQTSVEVDGKMFDIICETDCNGDIALLINGEYICDVDNLPTRVEILNQIYQQTTLDDIVDLTFKRSEL